MEITGKIVAKFDTKEVSGRFKKREFVLTYADNPEYPQSILMEFIQDKVTILDNYQVGQHVKVQFNINGRAWVSPQGETKYFNTLQAWRIEAVPGHEAPPPAPVAVIDDGIAEDDLPF